MIEMLGVLAIVGVLSVGGIAGYSKAMNKNKVIRLTEQIISLSTNITTLYASQKNYKEISADVLIKAGLTRSDFTTKTAGSVDKLYHIFGGEIMIEAAAQNKTEDGRSFLIIANKIPSSTCISVLTQNWGEGKGKSNLDAMMVVNGERDLSVITQKLNLPNKQIEGDRSSGRWGVFAAKSTAKWSFPAKLEVAAEVCNFTDEVVLVWKFS